MSSLDTDSDMPYALLPHVTEARLRFGLADDGPKLRIIWLDVRKEFELCSIQVPARLFQLVTTVTLHPTFGTIPEPVATGAMPNDSDCYVTIGAIPACEKDMEFMFKLLDKVARETVPNDGVYATLKPFNNLIQSFYYSKILKALKISPLCDEWEKVVDRWMLCGVPYAGPEITNIWRYHQLGDKFLKRMHGNIAYRFFTGGLQITADPRNMNVLQWHYYMTLIAAENDVLNIKNRYPDDWTHLVEENNWHLQDFERRLTEKTQDLAALARQFHPDGHLP